MVYAVPNGSDRRLPGVDAARGLAMLFVCLSHFHSVAAGHGVGRVTSSLMVFVSQVASPTFVLISGAMLGFVFERGSARRGELRWRFAERGVFLLLVVHPLLALLGAHYSGGFGPSFRQLFITDAIGAALILGPLFVSLAPRARVAIGAGAYLLAWLIVLLIRPDGTGIGVVLAALTGTLGDRYFVFAFPLLPWFGVYLASTALGSMLARPGRVEDPGVERLLRRAGACAMALALLDRVGVVLTGERIHGLPWNAEALLSAWQKYPPGPEYLLLFGGAGMVLLSLVFAAHRLGRFAWGLDRLAELGRASLFAFVLQWAVYFLLLDAWWPALALPWPLLFALSVVGIWGAARLWLEVEGNRFLSIPLRPRFAPARRNEAVARAA